MSNTVICIDDSFRPNDIPLSYWVKKNSKYTIIDSYKDMNGIELVELLEIDLRELGTIYKGFASSRFKPIDDLVEELVEVDELVLTN